MDRGAWRATVCRVAQSQTRLKQLSTHTHLQLGSQVYSFSVQCMDRGIALTQARYLEKEEKYLPPPRLVDFKI